MRDLMKCVKSTIPRAANAIFSKTPEGNLDYQTTEYDVSRELLGESGHITAQKGDSGSAFWTTLNLNKEKKNVLVALCQGALQTDAYGEYHNIPNFQCRQLAIKITKEMINWIERLESW